MWLLYHRVIISITWDNTCKVIPRVPISQLLCNPQSLTYKALNLVFSPRLCCNGHTFDLVKIILFSNLAISGLSTVPWNSACKLTNSFLNLSLSNAFSSSQVILPTSCLKTSLPNLTNALGRFFYLVGYCKWQLYQMFHYEITRVLFYQPPKTLSSLCLKATYFRVLL